MILTILIIILFYIFITLILRKYIKKTNYKLNNINYILDNTKDILDNAKKALDNDGIIIISQFLNSDELLYIKNLVDTDKSIEIKKYITKKNIKKYTNQDYEFQDYIFIIKQSQLNSCHRDYNSIFFNKNQKYPSYTLLFFLNDIDKCLDIIPKSHKTNKFFNINLTDFTESIKCNIGDAILFNSSLVHSGSINKNYKNHRIQMKISHKDDRYESLHFFENINKKLDRPEKKSYWYIKLEKHLSCLFPIFGKYIKETNNNIFSKYIYKKIDNI